MLPAIFDQVFNTKAPRGLLLAILSALSVQVLAQVERLPASDDEIEDGIIQLAPFYVSADENAGYFSPTSVIATGFAQEVYRTPINVSTLTQEFLADVGIDDLAQATAYISGVVAENSGFQGPGFRVRGFQASWLSRNGVRRYTQTGTENLDRIEVVKGPASIFLGQVAPGGVVNYVTRRPNFIARQELTLKVGTEDHYRAEVSSQGPLWEDAPVAYRVYASVLDSKDWRDFEFRKREFIYGGLFWKAFDERFTLYVEYETGRERYNDAHELPGGNANWFRDVQSPPADIVAAAIARRGPPSPALGLTHSQFASLLWSRDFEGYRADYLAARGESPGVARADSLPESSPWGWEFNSNGPGGNFDVLTSNFTAEATLTPFPWMAINAQLTYDERENFGLFQGSTRLIQVPSPFIQPAINPTPSAAIDPVISTFGLRNRSWFSAVEAVLKGNMLNAEHTLLLGLSLYEDEFRSLNLAPTGAIPAWADDWNFARYGYIDMREVFNVDGGFQLTASSSGQDNTTSARYITYTSSWWNGRLSVLTGARSEDFTVRFSRGNGPIDEQAEFNAVTPMGGFVFELTPGVALFGSYSEAYQPNNGGRVRGAGATAEEQAELLPNKEGYGVDLGLKFNGEKLGLAGAVTAFEVNLSGTVALVDRAATDADPRNRDGLATNDVNIYQIGGQIRARGVEADFVWRPAKNTQVVWAYTWLAGAKVVENPLDTTLVGGRVRNSPQHDTSVWIKQEGTLGSWSGRWSAGLGMRYRTGFFAIDQPSTTNTSKADDSFVMDGMLGYRHDWGKWETSWTLNVTNLLDARYYEGATSQSGLRPGEARKLFLSMKVSY